MFLRRPILSLRFRWPALRTGARATWQRLSSIEPDGPTAALLIFCVALGVFIRDLAVNYPLILGDEGIFLIRAKYAGRGEMLAGDELAGWVPNALYLWLNHFSFYAGANYAIAARLINVVFLALSLILLYGIASQFVSRRSAALAALVTGVGPMSVYTAFVMPETMFLCAFLCLALVLIRYLPERPIYASFLSGIVLGGAALIKPHGLMWIPTVLAALAILKLAVPEWHRWAICGAAAGTVLGTALATVGILNYALLGRPGFSLGPTYTALVERSTAASSIGSMFYVICGHLAMVLSLYALPALVVVIALCPGAVLTSTLAERIRLKMLLIFTVLTSCVLLITTSKFTVSVVGRSPFEQLNRVHVRYYFFILPLLLVLYLAVYERLDWTKTWVRNVFQGGCTVMCAGAAFCIFALDRRYSMLFPDFPDGFWFNMNPNFGRSLVFAVTCGTLFTYAWRRMPSAVFLCTFGIVSLVGSFYISLFVIQPATITDRAAAVFERVIGRERLDAGTVFDTEPADGEVYRLLFDLPGAYDLKIVNNQDPIPAEMLPEEREWALVTSSRAIKFPYAESLAFGRYHLYLRNAQPGMAPAERPTELAPGVPFLSGACAGGVLIGFQQPESWGIWSAEDPAKIVLSREMRGHFTIFLTGNALGTAPQTLDVQMGNIVKGVQLRAEPTTFRIDYDLESPARAIMFSGVTPRSPSQLGMSADIRPLGFAIAKLNCISLPFKSSK